MTTITGRTSADGTRLHVTVDDAFLGSVNIKSGDLWPVTGVPVAALAHAAGPAAVDARVKLARLKYRGAVWPPPQIVPASRDLARNRPGTGVARQARIERTGATKAALDAAGTALAEHGLDRTDRTWDAGAAGERAVGQALEQVAAGHPAVTVLHSVPLGDRGDIDHLVIGPFGILAVNTKNLGYRGAAVVRNRLLIEGAVSDYPEQAAIQADRAASFLGKRLGWRPTVQPVVAISSTYPHPPAPAGAGVWVLGTASVGMLLDNLSPCLSPTTLRQVTAAARDAHTWTQPSVRTLTGAGV